MCNWGSTLKQSSAVHIQALVSADVILPGSSSKPRLLVINLASVPGRQLVNSPTAQSLERWWQVWTNTQMLFSNIQLLMTKHLLKRPFLLLFLILFVFGTTVAQTKNNTMSLKQKILLADSVVLISHEVTAEYSFGEVPDWDIADTTMNLKKWKATHPKPLAFLEKGTFNRKIILESISLNDTNKAKLISVLLRPKKTKTLTLVKCDEPRHSILIYKKNKVSYIDICFTCMRIHTSKNIHLYLYNFDKRKWTELEQFFKTNGLTKLFEKNED